MTLQNLTPFVGVKSFWYFCTVISQSLRTTNTTLIG
jgi:hypothetical protein